MKHERKRIRTSAQIQQRACELRQQMTPAEKLLWSRLRNRQLGGLKFRRQHPLGPFVADFYCAERRLVVEIDGDIHDLQPDRDAARTEQFEQYGYRVIRFHNEQVLTSIEGVLSAIEAACTTDSEERS
ncbi:MAG: endonuclease domain-containing protein [Anaerolineae bacterium]